MFSPGPRPGYSCSDGLRLSLTVRRWDGGVFFLAGGLALLITVLTIGYHVTRTALANPAEVLRSE